MVNVKENFTDRRTSDEKSDVSSDVDVTLSDVGTDDFVSVQIPQGIQLDNLHTQYKKNKRRGTDLNAYFIGHLVQRNLYRRNSINEYVPMSSKALRDVFGGHYAKYIQYLIKEDIVEEYSRPYTVTLHDGTVWNCKGTFSKSTGKSKQYRLTADAKTPLVEYKIRDKALVKKINGARIKKLQHLIKHNETARKVYESIKKISIDRDAATKFVREKYHFRSQLQWAKWFISRDGQSAKTLKQFITEILNTKKKADKKKILTRYGIKQSDVVSDVDIYDTITGLIKQYTKLQSRMRWIKVIDQIQKGNHSLISMTQDKYSGRIYHTFTLTAANIRQFIKLDNQPLVEMDGANCQWMLFIKLCNILCRHSFFDSYIDGIGIISATTSNIDNDTKQQYLSMLHSFLRDNQNKIQDEVQKLSIYLDKNLLRKMVVDAEAKRGKTITEAQAKVWLIKNVLFGNPNHKEYYTFKSVQAFRDTFPTLLAMIVKLKKYWIRESVYGYTEKNIFGMPLKWKAFPRLLQKMESDIFVKGMQHTQCDFLTLHDAIVTNSNGEAEVKRTLDRTIKENNADIKLKYTTYAQSI